MTFLPRCPCPSRKRSHSSCCYRSTFFVSVGGVVLVVLAFISIVALAPPSHIVVDVLFLGALVGVFGVNHGS